jgi:hypothetical protein
MGGNNIGYFLKPADPVAARNQRAENSMSMNQTIVTYMLIQPPQQFSTEYEIVFVPARKILNSVTLLLNPTIEGYLQLA